MSDEAHASMRGKAAIVTGATRGIGNGIFRALASRGVHVATLYHADERSAEGFDREARSAGVKSYRERVDVRELARLSSFVESTLREFGRIDYLVNNVGIHIYKPISDLSLDEWRLSQDIILNAPLLLSKLVLSTMRPQRYGRIVMIGASSKDYAKGEPGCGAFGIHKAALTVLTKTLAREEIANGITVNMVAPGTTSDAGTLPEDSRIPIDQIPIGRRIAMAEVVEAVMYFLSENSAAVTGQCIGVNGGLST